MPCRLQVFVAPVSLSLTLSVPLAVAVPATTLPSSWLPASAMLPARAPAALVTIGVSLTPVTLMTTLRVAVAPLLSVTVTVKLSLGVPLCRALILAASTA